MVHNLSANIDNNSNNNNISKKKKNQKYYSGNDSISISESSFSVIHNIGTVITESRRNVKMDFSPVFLHHGSQWYMLYL